MITSEQDAKLNAATSIEAWLTKKNIEVTGRVVFEDETAEYFEVESLSLRGAQREYTSWLKGRGFEPACRWENETGETGDDEWGECSRLFRRVRREGQDKS